MSSFFAEPRYTAMTRLNRSFIPGLPTHVVHRGNDRQDIFKCTGDYLFFRTCLGDAAKEYLIDVHSYVLMTNHVHLLMTPRDPFGISKAMHSAIRRYAGYFNTRYQRTGTLWEGRFHSAVIGSDFYLLACHRYIDNNPVRAGIVERPELYLWSSHRHYARDESDPLITPHPTVIDLAHDVSGRRRAYRALFEAPEDPDHLQALRTASRRGCPLVNGLPAQKKTGRPRKLVPDTSF